MTKKKYRSLNQQVKRVKKSVWAIALIWILALVMMFVSVPFITSAADDFQEEYTGVMILESEAIHLTSASEESNVNTFWIILSILIALAAMLHEINCNRKIQRKEEYDRRFTL